jgi:chromosome partitioning protein
MRVDARTIAANDKLHDYLATLPVPVVGWLRDTQNYVHLAARGLTLFDVAPAGSSGIWTWQGIQWLKCLCRWLDT